MQPTTFSPERVVIPARNMIREIRAPSKKNLDVQKCLCRKTYCCYDKHTNKYKFSSKGLNKRTFEDCGDGGPMSKNRNVLEETVKETSTNRGFRTIRHSGATYEQTKKGLSYFYPKRILEEDGIHTKPLHL